MLLSYAHPRQAVAAGRATSFEVEPKEKTPFEGKEERDRERERRERYRRGEWCDEMRERKGEGETGRMGGMVSEAMECMRAGREGAARV